MMPFDNIPKSITEFKEKFAHVTESQRLRVMRLIEEVNGLYENKSDKLTFLPASKGEYLYYDNLVFYSSKVRNSIYYFFPTETMIEPIIRGTITAEVLDNILSYSYDRGREDCIYWEFFCTPLIIWPSALSQAHALELFSQSYANLGDEKYLQVCEKILNTFTIPWTEGGVKDEEWDWYLEYPMHVNGTGKVRRVLNCQLDVLIILYRYCERIADHELAWNLFERGEKCLREHIGVFIGRKGHSFYSHYQASHEDRKKRMQSYVSSYHELHMTRLHQLYTITEDRRYRTLIDRMRKVIGPKYYPLSYRAKIIGRRTPETACPNCHLLNMKCKGCGILT